MYYHNFIYSVTIFVPFGDKQVRNGGNLWHTICMTYIELAFAARQIQQEVDLDLPECARFLPKSIFWELF